MHDGSDGSTNSDNRQHYIIVLSTGPSSQLIFLIWTGLPWALYTIFTRQQLLLIAVYKTSPMFYKHQQSTPSVLINSFVPELESQFNHRKCTFKRNKDVRAGFDMLCEIGRLVYNNNDRQCLDISIHSLSLSTPQNISNAIKRNVCNISISGGHYASASQYCQAHLDTPLTLGARK